MKLHKRFFEIKKYKREIPDRIELITVSGDPRVEAADSNAQLLKLTFQNLRNESTVLDIGAGLRDIQKALEHRHISAKYFSLDIDETVKHDFDDIDVIQDRFDLIIMFEVIEHMPFEEGVHYLERIRELLKPGGYLAISTPNVACPTQFMKNYQHVQHYPLRDLYGILRVIGFSPHAEFRRVRIRPKTYSIKRHIKNIAKNVLFRLLGFDVAHGIYILIQK